MAARCKGQVLVARSLYLGVLCVSWGVTNKGPELSHTPLPTPSQPAERPTCFGTAQRLQSEAPAPKGPLNPCEQEKSKSPSLRHSGQPEADGLLFLCPLVLLLRVWEGVTAAPGVWQIISICLVLLCLTDVRRSPYILCTFRLSKSRCFFHESLMMKDDTEGFFSPLTNCFICC